jgi:hypothetical protein
MSRSLTAAFLFVCGISALAATTPLLPDQWGSFRKIAPSAAAPATPGVFGEFGFVSSESNGYRGPSGKGSVTAYKLQDPTGALAAWEWLRLADSHYCDLADFCAQDRDQVLVSQANYVLAFHGFVPKKPELAKLIAALPAKRNSALPPVTNFVPVQGIVPNSSRYILGPQSLSAVAPELAGAAPGFDQGAEAFYAAYRVDEGTAKLVLFDYPSPEMARIHTAKFKLVPGAQAKRSGVLVAIVLPGATDKQADALLSRVKYQAKILWNEPPPPNPIPKLYSLLMNIIVASCILVALCLVAGLFYGGMRLYRRRYGTLEDDEAMTTLHLTGSQ